MCNLTYTTRLLDCQCPSVVVSMKISFIGLLLVLGGRFACVRLLLFIVSYVNNASYFSRLFRDQLNRFYCSLSAVHRVSNLKDL